MSVNQPLRRYVWVWFLWVVGFYLVWSILVFGFNQWEATKEHWPIALAMALGSYAAGSTPMGGGTIGFPVLVMAFDMPASLGRDFSFAVQSIGMTSASILILARRQPLAWAMLQGAMLGSLVGTPLGVYGVAPYIPELLIKLTFAVVWASFGILHLCRISEISAHSGMTDFDERWDFRVGLILGLFASLTVASVTGVGIDMVIYCALVLLCRADLKIAIPTSVVIMAFTSVVGVAVKWLGSGFQPGVYHNWLAAAPVVVLGAPLGVVIVNLIGRKPTLLFVAVLCVGQYVWTCVAEYAALQRNGVLLSLFAVFAMLIAFELLRSWGARLVGERISRKQYELLGAVNTAAVETS